jgi:DNA-binding IclR family transcriptional regulator
VADGKYRAGVRLITLGRAVSKQYDLATVAGDAMRDLRDALGHSVYLAQPEPDGLRVVASLPGRSMFEIGVKHGSLLEFHCSAVGKVALAFGPEALRERILRSRLEARTPRSIIRRPLLLKELDRVRRRGWAGSPNEYVIGLNAVAAPVFDAGGALSATLAIVDSVQFIPASPSAEQVAETLAAARRLSAALGHKAKGRG